MITERSLCLEGSQESACVSLYCTFYFCPFYRSTFVPVLLTQLNSPKSSLKKQHNILWMRFSYVTYDVSLHWTFGPWWILTTSKDKGIQNSSFSQAKGESRQAVFFLSKSQIRPLLILHHILFFNNIQNKTICALQVLHIIVTKDEDESVQFFFFKKNRYMFGAVFVQHIMGVTTGIHAVFMLHMYVDNTQRHLHCSYTTVS